MSTHTKIRAGLTDAVRGLTGAGEATGAGGDGKVWFPRCAHPHSRPMPLPGEGAAITRAWIMQPVEPRKCGLS